MIDFTKIIIVRPDINSFMMRPGYGNQTDNDHVNVIKLSPSNFNKQVFLLKKWLKERDNPEDRVMNFECQSDDGCFSFDKYNRIFNSRLRPDEKQELINEGDFIF